MFDFYYQHGGGRRKLFHVMGSHCSIGSARNNDLVVDSRYMTKRQAELRVEAGGIHLKDLGSLTGCWVNRKRVVDYGPLSELDEIEVGDISLTIKQLKSPSISVSGGGLSSFASKTEGSGDAEKTLRTSIQSDSEIAQRASPESSTELVYWGQIVHEQLLYELNLQRKDVNRMSDEQLRSESKQLIDQIIAKLVNQLPENLNRATLAINVLNEAIGLGPLEVYLNDDSITEIMVNNHQEIFIERYGKLEKAAMAFSSDATVSAVIERIITPLGKRIDESSPIVDARLKDGSRVNAIIPPLAIKGPSLTIRKFPKTCMQFTDLLASDALNEAMVEFLRVCVETRKNIIVSGGTGTGKTTLLNVLSNFIPFTDRIVSIEDAAELKLVQPNLVSLEARPANLEGKGEIPIRDLVKNALRMRPDRIVVGECRGGEAIDMLQAMNTGHDGSLTTIHANNPRDVLSRLEVLVLMTGMELPISAIREQVASAIDIIIQQTRFSCGARKITRITEVVGVESGTVQLQDLFRFDQQGLDSEQRVLGRYVPTGAIPTFYESLRDTGVNLSLECFSTPVGERSL